MELDWQHPELEELCKGLDAVISAAHSYDGFMPASIFTSNVVRDQLLELVVHEGYDLPPIVQHELTGKLNFAWPPYHGVPVHTTADHDD